VFEFGKRLKEDVCIGVVVWTERKERERKGFIYFVGRID
jgi:hypothetical protein